jgi:hypothetical protein
MTLRKHNELIPSEIHVPYSFTYANAAARNSATGLTEEDEGKFARQLDDDSIWMLTVYSVPTWVAIGGSGGGSGDRNIDGGSADSVYLPSQLIDGGDANG